LDDDLGVPLLFFGEVLLPPFVDLDDSGVLGSLSFDVVDIDVLSFVVDTTFKDLVDFDFGVDSTLLVEDILSSAVSMDFLRFFFFEVLLLGGGGVGSLVSILCSSRVVVAGVSLIFFFFFFVDDDLMGVFVSLSPPFSGITSN